MKRTLPAASPEAYVAALAGWRRTTVDTLRGAVLAAGGLHESIKWGHLVYSHAGPALLIRAEAERVLFGFWRGKRLRGIDPLLRGSGRYEMATREFRADDIVDPALARRLAREAVALNRALGDPQADAGKR